MIPSELERCIKQSLTDNKVPLMVNATCGTTVLGAYDPVMEIADICETYGIWLHIDVRIADTLQSSTVLDFILDDITFSKRKKKVLMSFTSLFLSDTTMN